MKVATTFRNLLPLFTRNFHLTPQPKSTLISSFPPFISSVHSTPRFYSSNDPNITPTQNPKNPNDDVEVITDQELKRRIARLDEGDETAIPDIFEAILKRKLLGISGDDEVLDELRRGSSDKDLKEEDFDYESEDSCDSESDDDEGNDLSYPKGYRLGR
ncbi:hypothetical protein M5689_004030 [Euphorbia peplus]|nr:hypothetical protein M5689_004030 [Euphorbia peplus]